MPDSIKLSYPLAPLHLACAKSASRYSMDRVQVDPKNSRIVATDGRILVVAPMGAGEQAPFTIGAKTIKAALRAKAPINAALSATEIELLTRDGSTREQKDDGEYPRVGQVIPPADRQIMRVSGALLIRLIKAMGAEKGVLTFYGPEEPGPIRIECSEGDGYSIVQDGVIGVIVPVSKEVAK